MQIRWISFVALGLTCAACGDRSVQVVTPFAEARDELSGDFAGRLLLKDGGTLEMAQGRLLGDWVCGRPGPRQGDACVEAARVTAVERDERRTGPGTQVAQGIALVPLLPAIAVWISGEREMDRKSRAAAERTAETRRIAEARAAERGEVLPPRPTRESWLRERTFYGLANCFGVRTADRKDTDGETLSEQVWTDREKCIDEAIGWFTAAGDTDKARRLVFIRSARQRYEHLACGDKEPGLDAPQQDLIGAAAGSWMEEYRAVVADPATYDYSGRLLCAAEEASVQEKGWPAGAPAGAATVEVVSRFPLTDLPRTDGS